MAITTRFSYQKTSESSEATVKVKKIQLQLSSYCKYSSRIMMIFRRNLDIGICNGLAMEEAIWNDQGTEV